MKKRGAKPLPKVKRCPQCGSELVLIRYNHYECPNPLCELIEVRLTKEEKRLVWSSAR
ncbi:hypothetical protein KEJ18_04640 [Candidatus Bathyarchaeota archaeon]|nr:hypothetical protein [Candidatus Bathyarchaeota archaeon]